MIDGSDRGARKLSNMLLLVGLAAIALIPSALLMSGGGFSPWTASDAALFLILLGMCAGAALCWRWPLIGTVAAWTLLGAAFADCRFEHETVTCLEELAIPSFGAMLLLVNAVGVFLVRRRKR